MIYDLVSVLARARGCNHLENFWSMRWVIKFTFCPNSAFQKNSEIFIAGGGVVKKSMEFFHFLGHIAKLSPSFILNFAEHNLLNTGNVLKAQLQVVTQL